MGPKILRSSLLHCIAEGSSGCFRATLLLRINCMHSYVPGRVGGLHKKKQRGGIQTNLKTKPKTERKTLLSHFMYAMFACFLECCVHASVSVIKCAGQRSTTRAVANRFEKGAILEGHVSHNLIRTA